MFRNAKYEFENRENGVLKFDSFDKAIKHNAKGCLSVILFIGCPLGALVFGIVWWVSIHSNMHW